MNEEKENKKEDDRKDDIVLEPEIDSESAKEPAQIIKTLKEKLGACQKERQEYLDGWQRARADFINAKKREEEERAEFVKFSKKELLKELLPALDSFHTAFGDKDAWEKVDLNWRMGVQYIYSQLVTVLERQGIALIEPEVGEPFDPKRHASIETVPVASKDKDHTIVAVVQKGYALYDKILQPAKVKIAEYRDS